MSDQNPESQHDALSAAGCDEIFIDAALDPAFPSENSHLAACPLGLDSANHSPLRSLITGRMSLSPSAPVRWLNSASSLSRLYPRSRSRKIRRPRFSVRLAVGSRRRDHVLNIRVERSTDDPHQRRGRRQLITSLGLHSASQLGRLARRSARLAERASGRLACASANPTAPTRRAPKQNHRDRADDSGAHRTSGPSTWAGVSPGTR
jgi:hypothetical protein